MSSNKTNKITNSAKTEPLKFPFALELYSLDNVQSCAANPYYMYNPLKWHFKSIKQAGWFTNILCGVTKFKGC